MTESFAFDRFTLDEAERRLTSDGRPVEINGRYFDALTLLIREQGKLVSKDRFLSEVWRGVPVTDEALTQCIRTLRRELGDDASRPRFIETVPKHGYRFIAAVTAQAPGLAPAPAIDDERWQRFVRTGAVGTLGAAIAGLIGGLIYGFAGASQPAVGATSILLVLLCLTLLVAIVGGAAVSFAIATAAFTRSPSWQWHLLSGAAGGLIVGAFGKLLGMDAFALLVGRSPGEITGATEGLLLGGAVGLATWLGLRTSLRRGAAIGAFTGGVAGILVALVGGRMMLGSLSLASAVPGSRLRIDHIARLFGETDFGPITHFASSALEGALFSGCVVGALLLAMRSGN